MSKCRHCPTRAGACVAERPGWSFACKLAANGTKADRAFIVNRSAIDAGTFVAPPSRPAPEPPRPKIPLADSIRAARLGLHRCPYASPADCGCSAPHCHHLGRLAGLADCAACLGPAKKKPETDAHVDPL